LTINGSVETDTLQLCYRTDNWIQKDIGLDWTCDPITMLNVHQMNPDWDVGSTTITFPQEGDCKDAMTIDVDDVYPCYYNNIDFSLRNTGSVPAKLDFVDITFNGETFHLERAQSHTWYNENDDPIITIGWHDSFGVSNAQPEDGEFDLSMDFHIEQFAEQDATYTWSFVIGYSQWNCTETYWLPKA
jgi:hypothetical protein